MGTQSDQYKKTFLEHLKIAESFENKGSEPITKEEMYHQWMEINDVEPDVTSQHSDSYYKLFYRIHHENISRTLVLRKRIIRYSSVAALLIAAVVISITLSNQEKSTRIAQNITIQSPEGARTRFYLPDGSNGWLNSGSSIQYSSDKKTRNVDLQGEAFFDVIKYDGIPFEVHTIDFTVQVLGTKFNVCSYPGENIAEVVLQSGLVNIKSQLFPKTMVLMPGEILNYRRNPAEATISTTDVSSIDWINGILRFNNEKLGDFIPRIERFYNLDIVVENPELLAYTFYGQISNEPVENLFDVMKFAIPMNYTIEKRIQSNNGQFLKRKVVLSLTK